MRSYKPLAILLFVPGLASLTLLSGCAGGEEKKPEKVASAEQKTKPQKGGGKKAEELTAPTDGVLKGRVVLDGAAPKIEVIVAMAKHDSAKICLAADASESEKNAQEWILAPDKKGVANVVIKLLPPAGKKFKAIDPATKEVEMDQPHCAFVPHVVALTPGQILKVKNSAPVSHNTRMQADPSANENSSVNISPGESKIFKLNFQKNPITIACDVHNWMTAKVYINDSPYIAVTDSNGDFEIRNVPTGEELTVVGIHEVGVVDGDKEGVKRTFKSGDNSVDLKVKVR